MKNYPRHRASVQRNIFSRDYNSVIASAKRKHSDEFYIFCDTVLDDNWYSESSVSIFNDHTEHWKKINHRWSKV